MSFAMRGAAGETTAKRRKFQLSCTAAQAQIGGHDVRDGFSTLTPEAESVTSR